MRLIAAGGTQDSFTRLPQPLPCPLCVLWCVSYRGLVGPTGLYSEGRSKCRASVSFVLSHSSYGVGKGESDLISVMQNLLAVGSFGSAWPSPATQALHPLTLSAEKTKTRIGSCSRTSTGVQRAACRVAALPTPAAWEPAFLQGTLNTLGPSWGGVAFCHFSGPATGLWYETESGARRILAAGIAEAHSSPIVMLSP